MPQEPNPTLNFTVALEAHKPPPLVVGVPETFAPPLFDLDTPNGQPVAVVWTAVAAKTWEVPAPRATTPLPIYERTDAALYGAFAVPDGAKTLWEGCYSVQGNDTVIHLFRTPISGPRTGPYDFPPPAAANPLKYDSDACTVTKNDTTGEGALILECTVHEAISTTGRKSTLYRGVVTGLGITPYADGHAPLGAATNVFEGAPAPDPIPGGTVDLTPASITAVARAVLGLVKAELGSTDPADLQKLFQKIVKNGATDAGAGQGNLPSYLQTQNALLQVLRDGLAPWARDRAYEGDMAAEANEGKTTATATTGEINTNATERGTAQP